MSNKFLDFTGSKEELVQELKMYLHHFRDNEEVLVIIIFTNWSKILEQNKAKSVKI